MFLVCFRQCASVSMPLFMCLRQYAFFVCLCQYVLLCFRQCASVSMPLFMRLRQHALASLRQYGLSIACIFVAVRISPRRERAQGQSTRVGGGVCAGEGVWVVAVCVGGRTGQRDVLEGNGCVLVNSVGFFFVCG